MRCFMLHPEIVKGRNSCADSPWFVNKFNINPASIWRDIRAYWSLKEIFLSWGFMVTWLLCPHSNWRNLLHCSAPSFWVQTPGGTTRKWEIEGMKSLVVQLLVLFFPKLMHLTTNGLILLTILTIRISKCDCNICLEKYDRIFDHIWQAACWT